MRRALVPGAGITCLVSGTIPAPGTRKIGRADFLGGEFRRRRKRGREAPPTNEGVRGRRSRRERSSLPEIPRRYFRQRVLGLAVLCALFAFAGTAAGRTAVNEKLATIQADIRSERASIEERTARFDETKAEKEGRLRVLEEQIRAAKARIAELGKERPRSTEASGEAEPELTAEARAELDAGIERAINAATVAAEQLELHLKEVPGETLAIEQIGRALTDLEAKEKLERKTKALFALLGIASRAHHDATRIAVENKPLWAAGGREREVHLLRVGHAAFAYATPDGQELAIALRSPADAQGYRWSDQIDPVAKEQISRTLAAVRTGGPTIVDVPLDVSGQLRQDTLPSTLRPSELLEAGGYVMYPLALVALLALLLIAERAFVFYRLNRGSSELRAHVAEKCRANEFEEAAALCSRNPGAVARTMKAILAMRDRGREALENAVQEQLLHELPRLQRRMGGIAMLGAVAPLLGLLGTVTGIIQTFRVIHSFGNANPGLLAGGISEALTTTAVGLCIAIPVLLVHSILQGRLDKILSDAERQAATLLNTVEEATP